MLKLTPKRRVLFVHRLTPVLLAFFGVFSLLAISFINSPLKAQAAAANTVNFQARLQTNSGAIVPDGNYNVEFKLYSGSSCNPNTGSGCTAVWTEDRLNSAGNGLQTINGYLSANLGSVTPFPGTIQWDQQLWLSMNIGGTTTGTVSWDGAMLPYLSMTSVPAAFSANQLATTNASGRSTLTFQGSSNGDQNFVIQDQGAPGTYDLLTSNQASNSFIQLQSSTPGTAQTGSFNINGTGIANALQTSYLDAAAALDIGTTNATSITIGSATGTGTLTLGQSTNTNTINIGNASTATGNIQTVNIATNATGTGKAVITIGNTNGASSVAIEAGSGGIGLVGATTITGNLTASGNLALGTANVISGNLITSNCGGAGCTLDLKGDGGAWVSLENDAEGDYVDVNGHTSISVTTDGLTPALYVQNNYANSTTPVAVLQEGATPGAAADALQIQSSTRTVLSGFNNTGSVFFKNGSYLSTLNAATLSANQAITLPDATGTVALTNDTTNFIRNQTSQQTGNFNISGTGIAGNLLVAAGGRIDSVSGALNVGTTTAGTINLGNGTTDINVNADAINLANGNIYLSGNLTSNAAINVNQTIQSSNGSQYGIINEATFNPQVAGTNIYAFNNNPTITGSQNISAYIAVNSTIATSSYTGTVADARGINIGGTPGVNPFTTYSGAYFNTIANGGNTSGTVTNNQILIQGNASAAAAGGTVNNYGINLTTPNGSGAGTTNNYGLYIQGAGGGSTNYSIYNASSAKTYFAGNVGIGDTSPSTAFSVGSGHKFTVDASGNVVALGTLATGSTGQFQVDLSGNLQVPTVNAISGYKYNGTAGATTTCSGGQFLSNQVVQGGITTGGTCANGGTTTIGGLDTAGYNTSANGATISGTTLYLQSASGSYAGLVNTGTQTFAGNKTFSGNVIVGDTTNGGVFINNGATLNTSKALSNFTVNSAIGTATATVDSFTSFTINQTSSSITLSIPTPTNTTAGRIIYISNVGSAAFTIGTTNVGTGMTATFIWNGSAWVNASAVGGATGNYVSLQGGTPGTADHGNLNIDGAGIFGGTITANALNAGSASQFTIDTSGNFTTSGTGTINVASSTAFTVKNGGSTVFNVNTSTGQVTINNPSASSYALDVNGDINSNTNVRVGGVSVCVTTGCTPSSGSSNYVQNATTVQANANINIRSASASAVTALFQGANGQSTDIFEVASWNGTSTTPLVSVSNSGMLTATAGLTLGSGSTAGTLIINSASGHTVTLTSQSVGSNYTISLPGAIGTAGQCLAVGSVAGSVANISYTSCGSASHNKSVTLTAEYAGAVLNASNDSSCSSANSGTMTSDNTGSPSFNSFYKWVGTNGATNQCFDVVARIPVPSDYQGSPSLTVTGLSSDGSAALNVDVHDTSNAQDGTAYQSVSLGTNTWNTASISLSGTYVHDGVMTVRIRMTAKSTNYVELGNLVFNYNSAF